MVAVPGSLHSQSSRRPRARQPFDRRRIAPQRCAWMGRRGGGDYASRRRDRIFLSGEHFDFLARLDHGRGWWRIYLSGRARCTRRNAEARKETRSDEFFVRSRLDRAPEYRPEDARVARCASHSEAATVIRAFFSLSRRDASL